MTDTADAARLHKALTAIRTLRGRVRELEQDRDQPIAVIGMACRFPAAPDPDAYWRLLDAGGEGIGDIPADRWPVAEYYDPQRNTPGRMYCRRGGFLDDIAGFDAAFFGIAPREAKRMDPQQRLLLELAWEALEDSGRDPRAMSGSRTGVFVGVSEAEYLRRMRDESGDPVQMYDATGNALSVAGGRLAYCLGLRGPNLTLDTACSSALVAVHLAVAGLRAGESTLALAGGASLMLSPETFVAFCDGSALAADGRCKTFDAAADGYARGEGAGMVVLKRLADARADGDPVHAVIRGTALNQDGRTNGLTAPNGLAQRDVIRQALTQAGLAPAEVAYIEAHGTGTPLGDTIEIGALGTVFADRGESGPLLVGSAKTNIGHLEAAAGMAGLLKAILMLRHRRIPPHRNLSRPNPQIPWGDLPIEVPTESRELPDGAIGVSAFGFSGTNAHIVLTAATDSAVPEGDSVSAPVRTEDRPRHVLRLSARSSEALRDLAARYAAVVRGDAAPFADVCFTAGVARSAHSHRLAVHAASGSEAAEQLSAFAAGQRARVAVGEATEEPKVAFLFTGQGSQHAGMGRLLFETQPGFRRTLLTCDEILRDVLQVPLLEVLYPDPGGAHAELIERTAYAQPAIFALEYALAQLWGSWGVRPHVVLGHSTGEYAAACVAGCFGLEDGLRLIARRARLIEDATSGGATAAVLAPVEQIAEILDRRPEVSVAGINGPRETLIAGVADAVAEVLAELRAAGIDALAVKVPHAPHSPMIEPVLDEFEAAAGRIAFAAPRIRMISNVTGAAVDAVDAGYWRSHMREPVRFAQGMAVLAEQGCAAVLELGSQPVLQLLGRQSWSGPPVRWLSSLWEGRDDWKQLLHSVGELYAAGVEIDWAGFDRDYPRRRVPAPTYPFQRTHHWFTRKEGTAVHPTITRTEPAARHASILQTLREQLGAALELAPESISATATFIDLGADSLTLMRVIQDMIDRYGVTLTLARLFDDLDTPQAVAAHLDQSLPDEVPGSEQVTTQNFAQAQAAGSVPVDGNGTAVSRSAMRPVGQPAPIADGRLVAGSAAGAGVSAAVTGVPSTPAAANSLAEAGDLRALFAAQMDLMARQLDLLAGHGGANAPTTTPPINTKSPVPQRNTTAQAAPTPARQLTDQQREHLDALLTHYRERTAGSHNRVVTHRARRADTRMRSVRPETRSVCYPIIGERADGAYFWDVDGNKYVDIAMGVGVLLCGHNPPFVTEAVAAQLELALQTGPISALADEVADLVCELTGMERVFFTVTGTDAVRGALRMAQAATGRSRFVMFSGSYHGQDDRVLAVPDVLGSPENSLPMAPGISPGAAADPLILTYGSDAALAAIEAHAHELAGVLVEPVQSRNPTLQPARFLHRLRELTTRLDLPLIFDEVITGFRVGPGGAQEYFGVRADLAAYGKTVGGGMAVGVVAGRKEYLAQVDGGDWVDGPGPDPDSPKTYIGSTFEMHPLTMASTRAVLRHLRAAGPALQEELSARTSGLVERLNALFDAQEVPIRVLHFASVFRFAWKGNASYAYQPLEIEVFHLHLIARGIYIWEGRTCFLSTAHTDAALDAIVDAVTDTIAAMRTGGFLPARSELALGVEQRALLTLDQSDAPAWTVAEHLELRGPLDMPALRRAVGTVVGRHEALRTLFVDGRPELSEVEVPVEAVDPTGSHEDAVTAWWQAALAEPFDLAKGPLLRVSALRLEPESHRLALITHHICADGWSMATILEELAACYTAERTGRPAALAAPKQYRDFLAWQQDRAADLSTAADYWRSRFADDFPNTGLPTAADRTGQTCGARHTFTLDAELCDRVRDLGRGSKATLFVCLLAAYGLTIHQLTDADDIVIGTPQANRSFRGSESIVGYCAHFLPVRSLRQPEMSLADYLATIRESVLAAFAHQEAPFAKVREVAGFGERPFPEPLRTVFNLDRAIPVPEFDGLTGEFRPVPAEFALVEFRMDGIEVDGGVRIDCDYRTDLFSAPTVRAWCAHFRAVLEELVRDAAQPVTALPAAPDASR
ncbi:aminotransferase class III-fold pyridoxal phosphate-dependent enzyme [Nocardia panacis]|uniref:Aminotransferase class III-fold pyridoxal phosphate-dependent enzyme n=1 Tax=Nocardia panacis TaxID=2340916 RepID=A0A3A4K0N9_9NOCA|nr:type I polyketide synthase [Nocardia panacis]RJO70843.1 aminotransferase class III-fold pyridoxal phosphate-dependent enzyme [Nocardia panacis]